MRHCIDCNFHDKVATPMGNNTMGMMDICLNPENFNPVDATPLPCGALRSNESFCGLRGKHFKQKEKQPEPEGTLIQLHK